MNSTDAATKPRRLTRSKSDKVVSGVAGGLGEYFAVDPVIFRAGFVLGTIFTSGLALLVYFALAIVRDPDETGSVAGTAPPVAA